MTDPIALTQAIRRIASNHYALSWPFIAHAILASPEKFPRTIAAIREEYYYLRNGANVVRLRA